MSTSSFQRIYNVNIVKGDHSVWILHAWKMYTCWDFKSPELKAQVFSSNRLLSVCLLTFHNLIIYLRTTGPIITKLGTKHPWVTSFHIACISKHYSFKMYWSTTLYIPMSNTGVFEKIHQDCWLYQFFSYDVWTIEELNFCREFTYLN